MDNALLSVRDLTRRFGGFTAVQKVSFSLDRGEILGLIGPNGSGKSTTFNLIAGTLAPSEGSIRLQGREIGGTDAERGLPGRRRPHLPDPAAVSQAVDPGERQPGRVLRVRTAPEPARGPAPGGRCAGTGRPADVSGTAQVDGLGAAGLKKLEMARALATRPQLLLADESLGGLDEQEMEQAADMLSRIRRERGITIIWVEHIMGVLMRVVDRCIVLDHGEVIAHGSPAEVANHPKVIEVYLGTDATQVQEQVQRQGRMDRAVRARHERQAMLELRKSAPATAASRRCSTSISKCGQAKRSP